MVECHESPISQCQQVQQNNLDETDSDIVGLQQHFESVYSDNKVMKVEISRIQEQKGISKGYNSIRKKEF